MGKLGSQRQSSHFKSVEEKKNNSQSAAVKLGKES